MLTPLDVGEFGRDLGRLGVAGVVHEGVMGEQIGDAVETRLRTDGKFGRIGVRAEHLADLGECAIERRTFPIEFVDEDEPWDAERRSVAPEHDILRLDARHAVDHEHGEVGSGQAEEYLAAEVGVAGRVDEVDVVVVPVERCDGQRDRLLARSFLGIVVHHGGPLLDRSLPTDHPGAGEQRLGQARLAARVVTDQHDVPDLLRGPHGHSFRARSVSTSPPVRRYGPQALSATGAARRASSSRARRSTVSMSRRPGSSNPLDQAVRPRDRGTVAPVSALRTTPSPCS